MIRVYDDETRWALEFPYNPTDVYNVKTIGGARWNATDKVWLIPATLDSWNALHGLWPANQMKIDKSITRKMKREMKMAEKLRSLAMGDTAELEMLPEIHPELYEYVATRGYQLADIAFMALAPHPMNTNEPGTGKTVETIASVFEAGLDEAPVLVVAPKTALDAVWLSELSAWLYGMGVPAGTVTGQGDPLTLLERAALDGGPCWVVANPEAIKFRTNGTKPAPPERYEWIYEVDWGVVVLDEFHRMGLNNPDTLASKSFKKLKADKRIALSGTPMGGQPIKLWSVLNFLYPDKFSSKWAFAGNWLSIYEDAAGYKNIGDVRPEKREEFTRMMAEYSTRRIKTEIMTWLPPKQYVDLYVDLTPKQRKQYDEWEAEGELEIDEEALSAVSVLALYTRMRQFAGAVQKVKTDTGEIQLFPTEDSCKLPMVMELLEERGIGEEGTQVVDPVIIFSQFTRMINMVEKYLNKKGIKTVKITGEVKSEERTKAIKAFQDGEVDVFLMNTNAGGVAITLDRADTVIFLDETWNPDDQTQAEDRAHRGSKDRQVTVYRIISKGTIEEQIYRGNVSKETINQRVLNNRKKLDE